MTAYLVTTVVINFMLTMVGCNRFLREEGSPSGAFIAFLVSGVLAVWGLVLLLRDVP
jgi:hypothetical protein